MKNPLPLLLVFFLAVFPAVGQTEIWSKFELSLQSNINYGNPLYELELSCTFTSPSGKIKKINGFWDGDNNYKIRFAPDEPGIWTYMTSASDKKNKALHGIEGQFECIPNESELALFNKGPVQRTPGEYHLSHADGTPFFFTACTAWNGALKATDS